MFSISKSYLFYISFFFSSFSSFSSSFSSFSSFCSSYSFPLSSFSSSFTSSSSSSSSFLSSSWREKSKPVHMEKVLGQVKNLTFLYHCCSSVLLQQHPQMNLPLIFFPLSLVILGQIKLALNVEYCDI